MPSNIETYYFHMDEKRMGDIRLLMYKKDLNSILTEVQRMLSEYPSISKLKNSLYDWYMNDCTYYAESDPKYEKEYAISQFILMMNRVISLELLYIQFPRSDDLKELERELELFMLLCNLKINDSKILRRQQILNPVEFYNERYSKYLSLLVNVSYEERELNVQTIKQYGYEYYF